MKNERGGDNADVIPFAQEGHVVGSPVNKGLDFTKSFLSETYDDSVIDNILKEYYDVFESDLSYDEKSSMMKKSVDYQKMKDNPNSVLEIHEKIEDLQRQIGDLEDEIRYYLFELKSYLPFKK